MAPSSGSKVALGAAVALCWLSAAPVSAQLRLAHAFGDHMVLQRDQPVRIFGFGGKDGQRVVVRFAKQEEVAICSADGAFAVTLAPLTASHEGRTLVVQAEGAPDVAIHDVLVGDVWLCSGQSNMAFGLGGCDAAADVAAADLPLVRYRPYFEHFAGDPQQDLRDGPSWQRVSPQTAPNCTAVGFYFARAVQSVVDVPIGLLTCTVGGTEIECWMPPRAFADYPANAAIGAERERRIAEWQRALAAAVPAVEAWAASAKEAAAKGVRIPPPPLLPGHPNEDRAHWHRTQSLYNGMVHPLIRFGIRGVLWYQGENNGNEQRSYVDKFTALVAEWRRLWGRELPFYTVQLANWGRATEDPAGADLGFARCRMAQLLCTAIPRTGMAVTIDIGDAVDIHPHNKADVGLRLARWALKYEYGQELEPSGPLYASSKRDGDALRVHFAHVGQGLMVGHKDGRTPVTEVKGESLRGFAVAGADKKWHWAEAQIDGDTVVVRAAAVPEPAFVRYAFTANPAGCNLYNRDGLPASPFRSDDG